jgi:hypothetical protein
MLQHPMENALDKFAMPPEAIGRSTVVAIEQPADVDVGGIVVQSTAQA